MTVEQVVVEGVVEEVGVAVVDAEEDVVVGFAGDAVEGDGAVEEDEVVVEEDEVVVGAAEDVDGPDGVEHYDVAAQPDVVGNDCCGEDDAEACRYFVAQGAVGVAD